jgi:hypothetical protein
VRRGSEADTGRRLAIQKRGTSGLYLTFVGMTLRRPLLIRDMLGAAWAFRARRWYARAPFLPVPPTSYLRWRLETAYGDSGAVPPAAEAARFLRWATRMRRHNKNRY